ncbi:MAG: aminotransferase class III-fold pyridoxal phosphate-dependent enzyme [Leptolyngbya sp. SIO1E4]|nr:aminotransferase class III-fold pyridoxal phosphate-dependent enzyme [Leptolyngbya sp. SIO1E4]
MQPNKSESPGKLNLQQQSYLEAFITRYTKRTQTSKQLMSTYRPVLADDRGQGEFFFPIKEMIYPLFGKRSQGSKIWDADGNEYIDLTMSFGISLFGHNPQFLQEAFKDQLEQGIQLGMTAETAGEVAKLICEFTQMERVAFCGTRTEAVIMALRLARAATGRNKIVLFEGAYHGNSDGVLAINQTNEGNSQVVSIAPGITPNSVKDVLILEYDNPRSLEVMEAHKHELAAVLVEPVQSQRSDRLDLQPQAFLQQLRKLTQESEIALIFDETVFGFRIHPGGTQAWFNIEADLAIYGKPVGGGMPIGIVAGKAIYMDRIDGGVWNYGDMSYPQAKKTVFGSTYSCHPLSMAAALSVLKHLQAKGPTLQQKLNQRTSEFVKTVNDYFTTEKLPFQFKYFGSRFGITLMGGLSVSKNPAILVGMALIRYHLFDRGVYLRGNCGSLSTAHTTQDFDYVLQAIGDSVSSLREGNFLPG